MFLFSVFLLYLYCNCIYLIPILLNYYIDSDTGVDACNDDSDIDKSYDPNVTKDSECTIILLLAILFLYYIKIKSTVYFDNLN